MKQIAVRIGMLVLITSISTSVGCSKPADQPDLGKVTGIVTTDGVPQAGAKVSFAPDEGRGSHGITDAAGKYELIYIGDTKGAKVGNHKVHIATPTDEEDDSDPDAQPVKETIPAKYNTETILTAKVKPGKNACDFKLESK